MVSWKSLLRSQLDEAKKSLESSAKIYEELSTSQSALQKDLKAYNKKILSETKKLLVVRDISDIKDLEDLGESLESKLEKY